MLNVRTPTQYWNDSCALAELQYAVARGATGATSNPTIVLEVLQQGGGPLAAADRASWPRPPDLDEVEITWAGHRGDGRPRRCGPASQYSSATGGGSAGCRCRSIRANYRDAGRMLEQGRRFAGLAPEHAGQVPGHRAPACGDRGGDRRGHKHQCHGRRSRCRRRSRSAEAVERGLARPRRPAAISTMGPVFTLMIGRMDDWMKSARRARRHRRRPRRARLGRHRRLQAGRTAIYRERGYRTRLLAAAYRHHLHWTELVGGDVVADDAVRLAAPFNASGIDPEPRIDEPVDPAILRDCSSGSPTSCAPTSRTDWRSTSSTSYGPTVADPARVHQVVPRPDRRGPGRRTSPTRISGLRRKRRPPPRPERAPRSRLRPSRPPRCERSPSPS